MRQKLVRCGLKVTRPPRPSKDSGCEDQPMFVAPWSNASRRKVGLTFESRTWGRGDIAEARYRAGSHAGLVCRPGCAVSASPIPRPHLNRRRHARRFEGDLMDTRSGVTDSLHA